MIVRLITYHSKKSTAEMDAWIMENKETMRGIPGIKRVEFCRSTTDPTETGAMMVFESMEALTTYKETGAYQDLLATLRPLMDETKPATEIIMDVLDF